MPFVTRLVLSSGDRVALDGDVEGLKRSAERKGLDLRGPHTDPPEQHRVPLYKQAPPAGAGQYEPWSYTVYERRLEFTGHDETVRSLLDREVPDAVRREVEVTPVRSARGG